MYLQFKSNLSSTVSCCLNIIYLNLLLIIYIREMSPLPSNVRLVPRLPREDMPDRIAAHRPTWPVPFNFCGNCYSRRDEAVSE